MTTPEQDTYGRLLATLRPGLLRFARIQLRDPAQAEDIVQETLAAAWGKLGQFREEADLKTWVTAILKNKIADHFRSSRRTVVSLDSLREENEAADQAWHTCFDAGGHWLETAAPAAWRPPEDYAEQQDFFRTLENCLGGLPEDTARIFYLREIMGIEVEEICGRFGIGRDNCYVILHRARNSLRRCLQLRWFDIGA
ncbi:sigma-70 family RNA polymerase sigma factor [Neisseria elongata]